MKGQAESTVIALAALRKSPAAWYAARVVESAGLCPELSALMADLEASIALADGTWIRDFNPGDDDDEDY